MCFRLASTGVLLRPEEAVGGVGGAAGMKSEGMHAAVEMMDTMSTTEGTEPRKGFMSCASWITVLALVYQNNKSKLTAPPNGFAKLANAVAPTLPPSVNHISLYRVGAASTNG